MLKKIIPFALVLSFIFINCQNNEKEPDLKAVTVSVSENSPEEFEAQVKQAKAKGYEYVDIRALVKTTPEQRIDPEDSWEKYTVGLPALFKIFETDLINGYFNPETYQKNQEALKWKSDILQKHGMKASLNLREPQWMSPAWYKGREELMGARCDHPGVSRSPHYALNIDHEKVLGHYYQLAKKLVEHAPAVARIFFHSNDAGAGINWCQGLYPGPNGPANTKNRDMGERIQTWFQAVRDGSKAAGHELQIDFWPRHFTPDETRSVVKALKPPSRLVCVPEIMTNFPFVNFGKQISRTREILAGTEIQMIVNDRSFSSSIGPAELPFLVGETYLDFKKQGVRYLERRPLSENGPVALIHERCLKQCPTNTYELDQMILSVAEDYVGRKHAKDMYSAWKDFDSGMRVIRFDYSAALGFWHSVYGKNWLIRPFVPRPELLNKDETDFWFESMEIKDPNLDLTRARMVTVENHRLYKVDQYATIYNGYEMSREYFNRAIQTLDGMLRNEREGNDVWKKIKDQRDRMDMARCLLMCQFHAIGLEWILDRFAGKPDTDKWAQPREKRRLYEMIDSEIANCEHIIKIEKNKIPGTRLLQSDGEIITDLGGVVPALEKKIMIMQKHRHRVEDLFPGIAEKSYHVANYSEEDGKVIGSEETKEQLKNPRNLNEKNMAN